MAKLNTFILLTPTYVTINSERISMFPWQVFTRTRHNVTYLHCLSCWIRVFNNTSTTMSEFFYRIYRSVGIRTGK